MLMLCNMELLHCANILLAVSRVLYGVQITRSGLACPNHFVSVYVRIRFNKRCKDKARGRQTNIIFKKKIGQAR